MHLDDQGEDEKGRHFTTMSELEWVRCCEKYEIEDSDDFAYPKGIFFGHLLQSNES